MVRINALPHTCDFCIEGCQCDSLYGLTIDSMDYPGQQAECEYCEYGCNCGAEDPVKGDSGPSECECECQCCTCECNCEYLEIDADNYNEWIKKTCYACNPECFSKNQLEEDSWKKRCFQKIGKFDFYVRTLPTYQTVSMGLFGLGRKEKIRASLDIFEEEKRNKVFFSGPVHIPIISISKPSGSEIWMSLTPMEIFTQREAIPLATGNVLVAGLGMGWLTRRILESSQVAHVTQIELEPEIISIFGKPLEEMFPSRISFINDDVWNYLNSTDIKLFDSIIFDIWPSYKNASSDRKFQKLKRSHPNVWGWGDY